MDEIQAKEILDLEPVDLFGPVPIELLKCFDDRKSSGLDPPLDTALTPLIVFALDEPAQVFDVVPMPLNGLAGQGAMLALDAGKLEIIEVVDQQ